MASEPRSSPRRRSHTTQPASRRRRRQRLVRHLGAAGLGVAIFWLFWMSRPQWSSDMRLWKAVGDAGFGLLWATVVIGPLAKLWPPARKLLPWRRQLGIWFALFASIHALLILNGWAEWSLARFFGYEFIPQLGRPARMEPGFGLSNLLGLTALGVALLLAATSSDRAIRALGRSSWKYLHNGAYFVFYVGSLHALYFLFIHYTLSFHRRIPPPDWFRFWFLAMVGVVVTLHVSSFIKTVRDQRSEAPVNA